MESPERCIRTRGIKAASQALAEHGPRASLDKVAALAGCPKASLARVFDTKEALLDAALRALAEQALELLARSCELAGGGRAGAYAAAAAAARAANRPGFPGCPLGAAASSLAELPWAAPAVRDHKARVVAFYAAALLPEMGDEALPMARAVALVCDGAALNAGAGLGPDFEAAALMALAALLLAAPR